MSRRALCAGVLIALATSACATSERSDPPSTGSPKASTSQASSMPTVTSSKAPDGPAADILRARQVRADDYHDMSFGGETPESMTNQPSQVAFITPTANIACNWSPADPTTELGLTCLAKERTSPPPARPADCQYAWATGYVKLNPDGAVEDGVCAGGVLTPSIANPLEYGSALVAGDFGCLSAESGVTCAHIPSGRGFTFSRERLTTF